jgi:co-chaperonin GroES (HSP10)
MSNQFSANLKREILVSLNDLKPIGNYILVMEFQQQEKKSKGGLLLGVPSNKSDFEKYEAHYGRVVAVGDNCEHLQLGSMVCFSKFSGDDVEVDGIELRRMREADIIGIVSAETEESK